MEPGHPLDANELARMLFTGIEERGKDATGAAWWGPNALCLDKAPIPASKFKVRMSKHTSTAILHTRFATQGSPKLNRNNHPVRVGEHGRRVVGVHNGHIWNDDKIFAEHVKLERQAEVDSEAVFAYLYEHGLIPTDMTDVWGSYALGYLSELERNVLYLVRGEDSPLHIAKCKYGWVFASTYKTLAAVEKLVGGFVKKKESGSTGILYYEEGHYGVYSDGIEQEYGKFEFNDWSNSYSYGRMNRSTSTCPPYLLPGCEWEDEDEWEMNWAGTSRIYRDPKRYEKNPDGWMWDQVDKCWLPPDYPENASETLPFNIADVGYDATVRPGSQWQGTHLDPTDPQEKRYIHVYSDGSFIVNESVVPPFRYCSRLGTTGGDALLDAERTVRAAIPATTTHSGPLSGEEEEARREAASIVDLFKRKKKGAKV